MRYHARKLYAVINVSHGQSIVNRSQLSGQNPHRQHHASGNLAKSGRADWPEPRP